MKHSLITIVSHETISDISAMKSKGSSLSIPEGHAPSWKVQWSYKPPPSVVFGLTFPHKVKVRIQGGADGVPVEKWGDASSGSCVVAGGFSVSLWAMPACSSGGAVPYIIPEGDFICSASPWEGSSDRRTWTVLLSNLAAESETFLPGKERPLLDFPVVRSNHLAAESVTVSLPYGPPVPVLPSASPLPVGALTGFSKGITASPVLLVGALS